MKPRVVKVAWLQTPVDLPDFPGASTQFSPNKTPKARMLLTDFGLELMQGKITAFIPIANLKAVVFESEAESTNS